MDENFQKALDFVLQHEGGYWEDPAGGPTNFGISQKWHPDIDVKTLTKEKAAEIYYMEYWFPNHCNILSWPMNLIVFDTAVNQGAAKATELRMEASDWRDFLFRRIRSYVNLKGQVMEGWINRVLDLYEVARKGIA